MSVIETAGTETITSETARGGTLSPVGVRVGTDTLVATETVGTNISAIARTEMDEGITAVGAAPLRTFLLTFKEKRSVLNLAPGLAAAVETVTASTAEPTSLP